MDYNAFAQSIKTKYPQYNTVDNLALAKAMVQKYPAYASQVNLQSTTTAPTTPDSTATADKPGYLSRVISDYKKGGDEVTQAVNDGAQKKQSLFSTGLQTAGAVAKAAVAPITEAVSPVIDKVINGYDTKDGTHVGGISDIPAVQKFAMGKPVSQTLDAYQSWVQAHPEASKNLESIVNIAGLLGGEQPLQDVAEKGVNTVGTDVSKVPDAFSTVKKAVIGGAQDSKEAVGQVTQAATKDVPSVTRALTSKDAAGNPILDTHGVSTYGDLSSRVKDTIPVLARQVDSELAKDTTLYKPEDLAIETTTNGGKTVTTDHITKALTDLHELYTKTGDTTSAENINEILDKANSDGLSKKDVNDIARVYGQEFGTKAFSKITGDPLTSVNAQSFENTRSGLKDTARQGMSSTAKQLDSHMSDLYNLKGYTDKMTEAVNKLQNRISNRGLGEKIGHYGAKIADTLTGGTLRGVVSGILPRGVGYKTLNALDLEEALKGNLKMIEKANNQGTDAGFINAVRRFKPIELPKATTIEKSPIVNAVKSLKEIPNQQGGFINLEAIVKSLDNSDRENLTSFVDDVVQGKKPDPEVAKQVQDFADSESLESAFKGNSALASELTRILDADRAQPKK